MLSVLISSNGDYCISAGLDSKIIVWNMPNYESTDQYDSYCNTYTFNYIYEPNLIYMKIILASSVFLRNLNGHTDAIWGMSLADNILASVSADSTIRIWNPFSMDELSETGFCLNILNENKSNFLFESKL